MDDITRLSNDSVSINRLKSQVIYPIRDLSSDTFLVVINLPNIGYDEIVVSVEPRNLGVSATLLKADRLMALFDESYAPQVFTTNVRLPEELDIENADAEYDGGFIRVSIPYRQ